MSLLPQLRHLLRPLILQAEASAEPVPQAPAFRKVAYWNWEPQPGADASHVVVCVHGLSRQGRDFDVLAERLTRHARVVCPDVAGRGESDWLANPMDYQIPNYGQDMGVLLMQLRSEGVQTIDWVGTSMGGLIGMGLAVQPGLGIRRLVLNDVGPAIQGAALQRIGTYLGLPLRFESQQAAIDYLWSISQTFGPHTPEQWRALSLPMLREQDGLWFLHYDPAIATPFKALTDESARAAAEQGEALLWQLYDAIAAPTLVLRGAESDLLSSSTATAMTQRGPKAALQEFAGVGHAPTLVSADQVEVVAAFLFAQA